MGDPLGGFVIIATNSLERRVPKNA